MLNEEDIKNLMIMLNELIIKEKIKLNDFNTCCENYSAYAKLSEEQIQYYEVLQKKINEEKI